ncbi:MAG: hypothetical protein OWT28_07090, partial [Firmicutes bacterium]|nr:hypothetical protein [Bacillota bacterium]
ITQSAQAESVRASDAVTQASVISQLMAVFHDVPSWPKYLEAMDPETQSYDWAHVDDAIAPTKWIGLACVFPGSKPSQYPLLLGIREATPKAQVTAGQLAQWIVDWEVSARRVDLSQEPTQNPFALLKRFSFFWGTEITGPKSVITGRDMATIRNNIVEVSRGWRILSRNQVQFLEPLADCVNIKIQFPTLVNNHQFTKADWPEVYGAIVKVQDSMTLTVEPNGNVVYRYQKGTGYSLGIGGHFVNQQGIVYSAYSWKIAHMFESAALNEPSPEVFEPLQHPVHFPFVQNHELGMNIPKTRGYVFFFDGMAINRFAAVHGLGVASDLSYAIGYVNGQVNWVKQLGPASLNYPSEVNAYGS